jgi:hypothetical protein
MSLGATLVGSLLLILARPATWPVALAAFLLRGGFLLVLAPIVVLPSAVSLGNVVTPLLSTVVFQGFTPPIALALTAAGTGALLWLFGGGLIAAAAESEVVREIASDEEGSAIGPAPVVAALAGGPAWRVLAVRLLAHVPFVLAVSWGATRIVAVAYRELTVPSDVAVSLVARVIGGAGPALAIVLLAWLLGEAVGAIAARRVILLGDGVVTALRGALRWIVRRPRRCVALGIIPLLPLALLLVVIGLAGSATWGLLRTALALNGGTGWLVGFALVTTLVGLFGAGLLLIGATAAWRSAVWTVELARTFGVTGHGPEGEWKGRSDSGTLGDLRPRVVDPGHEVMDVLEDDRLRRL